MGLSSVFGPKSTIFFFFPFSPDLFFAPWCFESWKTTFGTVVLHDQTQYHGRGRGLFFFFLLLPGGLRELSVVVFRLSRVNSLTVHVASSQDMMISHVGRITIKIYILTCRSEMLCRICLLIEQVQPRKYVLYAQIMQIVRLPPGIMS